MMKSTGIVRNLDELGRLVIPKEIRTRLNIQSSDPIDISVDGNKIILTKCESSCLFCGCEADLISYKGKMICKSCVDGLRI